MVGVIAAGAGAAPTGRFKGSTHSSAHHGGSEPPAPRSGTSGLRGRRAADTVAPTHPESVGPCSGCLPDLGYEGTRSLRTGR